MNFAILAAAVAALSGPVCMKGAYKCNPHGTLQEQHACAAARHIDADQQLTATFRTLRATLPARRQTRLVESQRAWLDARDPRCRSTADRIGQRSLWSLAFLGCMAEEADKRSTLLREHRPR